MILSKERGRGRSINKEKKRKEKKRKEKKRKEKKRKEEAETSTYSWELLIYIFVVYQCLAQGRGPSGLAICYCCSMTERHLLPTQVLSCLFFISFFICALYFLCYFLVHLSNECIEKKKRMS
jgi:hypothetical protein